MDAPEGQVRKPDRAILFIDGNNWFNALKEIGVDQRLRLSYSKISQKLTGVNGAARGTTSGLWTSLGIGSSTPISGGSFQELNLKIRGYPYIVGAWKSGLQNPLAEELTEFLVSAEGKKLAGDHMALLSAMAYGHRNVVTLKEKAVDVALAVDLFRLAAGYEAACLLSGDGDFTPAVEAVCAMGKKVDAAAAPVSFSSALSRVCSSFIRLERDWFGDCYF